MPAPEARRSARDAIDDFIRHLADCRFAITTQRIRRHFLGEYLQHAQQAVGAVDIVAGELMDPARAEAWLLDAAAGNTRTRNTLGGPDAAAYPNSMRVRIDSYNAFAEFLCLPDRYDSQPPADGYCLTPADTERLLHDLAVRRPVHANVATSLRTAAVAALVADTGLTVPELARLNVSALHLESEARVELADRSCPLSGPTVQILTRWLGARAVIIAELQGSDPGYLWIPTKPGRPRGGREPVKPGLTRAAVRDPPRSPPHPRQPGARHPAPSRRLPRVRPVTFSIQPEDFIGVQRRRSLAGSGARDEAGMRSLSTVSRPATGGSGLGGFLAHG